MIRWRKKEEEIWMQGKQEEKQEETHICIQVSKGKRTRNPFRTTRKRDNSLFIRKNRKRREGVSRRDRINAFQQKRGTSTLVLEHMSWTRIAKLFMFPHVTFGHPSSRKEEYRPFCYEVLLNKWGGRITVCRVMNALDSIFLWFKTMIRVTYRAAKNLCRDSCRASGFHVSSRLSRLTIFCQPQVPMPTTHVTNNSKLFTREQQMKLKKF